MNIFYKFILLQHNVKIKIIQHSSVKVKPSNSQLNRLKFRFFKGSVVPWCSGYHYCTSLNKAWTQVLRRFKFCWWRVGDSGCGWSLTMVLAGNKAKRLSSFNHTTKKILHLYYHYYHHQLATSNETEIT